MTLHPRARLVILWLFSGKLGWLVGFMSAFTAPAPRYVDLNTMTDNEVMKLVMRQI